jgi:hypothetical protein
MPCVTSCVIDPAAKFCVAVLSNDARFGLVPYSNHAAAATPFGFTVPFSVATFWPTEVALSVTTVGRGGAELSPPPPPPQDAKRNNRKTGKAGNLKVLFFELLFRFVQCSERFMVSHLSA